MESGKKRRLRILLENVQEKKIYLYGAGTRGRVAFLNITSLGLEKNIMGFLDDNRKECSYCGKCVHSPDDAWIFENPNTAFIITTYTVSKMSSRLLEKGVSADNIYFFPELLIDDIEENIFHNHRETIEQVYHMLCDDLSKYIYKSLFEVYTTGNVGVLSRTKGSIQYFPINDIKGFSLSETESFVDCGAYDGDTIRMFMRLTNGNYNKIWAIEPDTDNYRKLEDYVKKREDTKIQLIQGGVFNKDSEMFFDSKRGTSSSLSLDGKECVNVYQLDSLIKEPVTFIKMDIEGTEKEALSGAAKIISEYKPVLAICIYHKIEDLWEIPMLIKDLNPKYRIYIRNYEDRIDETVCYAIDDSI